MYFRKKLKSFLLLDIFIAVEYVALNKNGYILVITSIFLMAVVTVMLKSIEKTRREKCRIRDINEFDIFIFRL